MTRDQQTQTDAWSTMSAAEWRVLSAQDKDILLSENGTVTVAAGQQIFSQGQPCQGVYCVLDGTVAMHIQSDAGDRTLLRLAEAGTTIGQDAVFAANKHTTSASALTQTTVQFVSRENLEKLMERYPALMRNFLQTLSTHLNTADILLSQTIHRNVRARLALLLLKLKDKHGDVDEDGNLMITLPMSRRDMASAIGTRPESLSRAIRALQDSGKATFRGKLVTVSDLDDLLDEAEAS